MSEGTGPSVATLDWRHPVEKGACARLDARAGELREQGGDDGGGVVAERERGVDQVDAQHADRLLLQLRRVVQHADVHHDVVWHRPAPGATCACVSLPKRPKPSKKSKTKKNTQSLKP